MGLGLCGASARLERRSKEAMTSGSRKMSVTLGSAEFLALGKLNAHFPTDCSDRLSPNGPPGVGLLPKAGPHRQARGARMTRSSPTRSGARNSVSRNKDLVRRYFVAIGASDLTALARLLDSQVRVRCAGGGGSSGQVAFDSFAALENDIRHNLGELYDPAVGIQPEILNLTAEADRVAAEVRIRGRSARSGEAYDNLYAFFFWIRDEVIVEIHEHLDTAYVGAKLLGPAGIASGTEMPWLAE
jgi:ketosteroid isomerase-like protein